MQKSKYNVTIHRNGSENEMILRAIASHNEGLIPVSIEDLMGYVQTKRAMFPLIYSGHTAIKDDEKDYVLNISEDGGKTYTLTLEYCEVFELSDFNEGEEDSREELAEAHVLHNPSNLHP